MVHTSYTLIEESDDEPVDPASIPKDATFSTNVFAKMDAENPPLQPPGGELALNIVSDQPNILERTIHWLGDSYTSSKHKKRSLGITLVIVGLAYLAIKESSHGSTTPVTSPQTALIARAAVQQDLAQTSVQLASLGYNQALIQSKSNQILVARGTSIALAAAGSGLPIRPMTNGKRVIVTGMNRSPKEYASLNNLDMNTYFNSFSEQPNNADIVTNGAVIHGFHAETIK